MNSASLSKSKRAPLAAFAFSAVVFMLLIPRARAQEKSDPRASILVSTSWVAKHLNDPDLVLLHVGEKKEYDQAHIPGARFVTLNDISVSDHVTPGALMLQMPATEVLRKDLAALGISDKSRVVVYYGGEWVSPATRVVFTLDYAGLGARTVLLDGGLQAWTAESRPVSNVTPPARAGRLSELKTRPIVVDGEWVKSHVSRPGISVVDGRAAAFYDGVQTGMGMHAAQRTGHIAGAKSVPFTEVTDDKMKLRSREELAALFLKAGVQPGDTVVGYCHVGQQATAMLFAARSLGHPVLLYDGSFEDWSAHADYPVENPSAKVK
ncbi:MAG: sulfurtransferase [Gemmatimonadaceae bacterium]